MFDPQFLHLMLMGAAVALSVLIFLLIAAEAASCKLLKLAMLLIPLCSAAYVLLLGKNILQWDAGERAALRVLAAPGVYFLWLAVRLLFDDWFRPARKHLLPLVMILITAWMPALPWMASGNWGQAGNYGLTAIAMVLALHMLWILAAGKSDDLDESRRRLRPIMTGVGGFYILLMTLGRLAGVPLQSAWAFDVMGLALLLAIKMAVVLTTRGQRNPISLILNREPAEHPGLQPPAATDNQANAAQPAPTGVDAAERCQALALAEQIRSQRLYADCTLSLARLAAHLDLPEYRIRQLTNRVLGFRNFSMFLNHFRLEEASRRLGDPAQAKLPILSIALDTGFGSIGPFNRSFKERYGLTPSEFRQLPASEQAALTAAAARARL